MYLTRPNTPITEDPPARRLRRKAVTTLLAVAGTVAMANLGVAIAAAPSTAGAAAVPQIRAASPVSYPVNPLCASLGQRGTTESFSLTSFPASTPVSIDIVSAARRVPVRTLVTSVTGTAIGAFAQPDMPAGAYSLWALNGRGALIAATPLTVGASDCWRESMPDGQSLVADFAGAGFRPGTLVSLSFLLSGGTGETLAVDGNGSFARANTNLGLCTQGSVYVATINGTIGSGAGVHTNTNGICYGTHFGTTLFP